MTQADSDLPVGPHPEVDIREVMGKSFADGRGVIQLQPGMTDAAILTIIKLAVSTSNGQPFTVIPARQ